MECDYSKPPLYDAIGATTRDSSELFSVKKKPWHPPHQVKVWTTKYRKRIYRVTQLPRCEHIETIIAYNSHGETLAQAKRRLGGIAACTGSFHNSQSFCLADFVQQDGEIISSATTGRAIVTINQDGILGISTDYCSIKGQSGISALALGQRLIPLERDGFSLAFMNRITARMAIGINENFIFLVQSKTSIWHLARFMSRRLPCKKAVNSDGGHVVRGKAPVHIVFRWKKQ
ncbi:phosphodiester glycosidase family protein [bacterium]|nr:phosphodiester glycosidase family protein [bacterium]